MHAAAARDRPFYVSGCKSSVYICYSEQGARSNLPRLGEKGDVENGETRNPDAIVDGKELSRWCWKQARLFLFFATVHWIFLICKADTASRRAQRTDSIVHGQLHDYQATRYVSHWRTVLIYDHFELKTILQSRRSLIKSSYINHSFRCNSHKANAKSNKNLDSFIINISIKFISVYWRDFRSKSDIFRR